MPSSRALRLLALLCLLPVANCTCHGSADCATVPNNQPDHPSTCTQTSECGPHYACRQAPGSGATCCLYEDLACNTDADCCPGQTCSKGTKTCVDQILECTSDSDCGNTGDRFCVSYTDHYGTTKRCRMKPCGAGGSCPSGQTCFAGVCTASVPCNGSCPSGSACVAETGQCQPFACPVTCQAGYIAAFADQANLYDTCDLANAKCACVQLPALTSDDLGRYSAIAADDRDQQLVTSSYDGQYGDLVVSRYDASGNRVSQDWVDGVPSTGTAKYSPAGPRGGVVDPGPDVGRYTDVAVSDGGTAYVSYYDVTNGDLKLAYQPSGGKWTEVTVDGAHADLGLFTSIALDANGHPAIAYFQRGGNDDFDPSTCPGTPPTGDVHFITALKLATANSATPGASDFTIRTLACASRPEPPCTGCQQTCADPGTGPSCYASATGCSACDPTTEACVSVNGAPTCAKKYNPSTVRSLPDGVGIFPVLTFQNGTAVIAYMRRQNGEGSLRAITVSASGVVGPEVTLDASGDTGYFPDLKVDPLGNLALTWEDMAHHTLWFRYGSSIGALGAKEAIDDGVGPSGAGDLSFVGTDSSIAFAPPGSPNAGAIYVAYQNASRGDLELARRTTSWSKLPAIRTTGAVGFFTDTAVLGTTLFVSNAQLHAKSVNGTPRVDNRLWLDQSPMN